MASTPIDYGLIRSILNTIPTHRAYVYDVTSSESLGSYLLALADEVRQMRTTCDKAEDFDFSLDYLKRQVAELTEDRDHYVSLAASLRQEVAALKLQAKFPGQTIEDIADRMWAEHRGINGSIIPAIKEFRALTGMGLRDSKDAIDGAIERAGSRSPLSGPAPLSAFGA
jgi:ribosomal protein L7/L12